MEECIFIWYLQAIRRVSTHTSIVQYWSTSTCTFFGVAGRIVNGWCFPQPRYGVNGDGPGMYKYRMPHRMI